MSATPRSIRLLLALSLSFLAGSEASRAALPDADGDGFYDALEGDPLPSDGLGSDKGNANSTPESIGIPATCFDGVDNDLDGNTDVADSGCAAPAVSQTNFPAAGLDIFPSRISLNGYDFVFPPSAVCAAGCTCTLNFDGRGPVVIDRSPVVDLGGGLKEIPVEIVAMQLTGTATITASVAGVCPLVTVSPVIFFEDPSTASTGKVTDTNTDPGTEFPAKSFFDVYFEVDTPLGNFPGEPSGGVAGQCVAGLCQNAPLGGVPCVGDSDCALVEVANTIRSLPPYHSPGNPNLNPDCYVTDPEAHKHCPVAPLGHFKCYKAKAQPLDIDLEDQFGPMAMRIRSVMRPKHFCTPVEKDGSPIFDEEGHLKCYNVQSQPGEPRFDPLEVLVFNQFGVQELLVKKPSTLCLPTQKNPEQDTSDPLDHFKCYEAKGDRVLQFVSLDDQFIDEVVFVQAPIQFCNPVEKTIGNETTGIGNPDGHLVCYQARQNPRFGPGPVVARNQFGVEMLLLEEATTLCVPSEKLAVNP